MQGLISYLCHSFLRTVASASPVAGGKEKVHVPFCWMNKKEEILETGETYFLVSFVLLGNHRGLWGERHKASKVLLQLNAFLIMAERRSGGKPERWGVVSNVNSYLPLRAYSKII